MPVFMSVQCVIPIIILDNMLSSDYCLEDYQNRSVLLYVASVHSDNVHTHEQFLRLTVGVVLLSSKGCR